jgi:hypothetical protein
MHFALLKFAGPLAAASQSILGQRFEDIPHGRYLKMGAFSCQCFNVIASINIMEDIVFNFRI